MDETQMTQEYLDAARQLVVQLEAKLARAKGMVAAAELALGVDGEAS